MGEKYKVAFIGSGIIGSGLAVNALMHGYPAFLQTRSQVEKMKGRVAGILDLFVENKVCIREEADAAAALATYTTSIGEAVTGAKFIQESGPERLEVKRELYAQIEEFCPENAVIGSSTTALLPSDLQEGAKHPERILVGHPYHPSYLLPLVELCGGKQTSMDCVKEAVDFYRSIGKLALVSKKEAPGFIVNRASWAAFGEAKKTVLEGFCTVEEMDKALMFGPGMRMAITGQLLTISLGIEGGMKAQAEKYGMEQSPDDLIIADGVEAELAARPPEIGNTEETVSAFRDKVIIEILRLQNMI